VLPNGVRGEEDGSNFMTAKSLVFFSIYHFLLTHPHHFDIFSARNKVIEIFPALDDALKKNQ
jgi:hypothetical protein